MMVNPIYKIVHEHKMGSPKGIYSVCSSNPLVVEAAMSEAKAADTFLLVESTSNQVDQFGGYSGLTPEKYISFVKKLARKNKFSEDQLILGGDHLGPHPWKHEKADQAMDKAKDLIRAYCSAGYTKIHLDTSMSCAGDSVDESAPLDEMIVAERAAELCQVAEEMRLQQESKLSPPVYIIGTEVPVPGGARESLNGLQVTRVEDVQQTLKIYQEIFLQKGLEEAWDRVVALVVQPGVEFSHEEIINYDRRSAADLSKYIANVKGKVYEAHSTDYQTLQNLQQLVEDHFAILKVGPWLTFTLRESVYSLALIEEEWLDNKKSLSPSRIADTFESVMLREPDYWKNHYHGDSKTQAFLRVYSYSDRIRYYWAYPEIQKALKILLQNLEKNPVPMVLINQYFPDQYQKIRQGKIRNHPLDIIKDKIQQVCQIYLIATGQIDIEQEGDTV